MAELLIEGAAVLPAAGADWLEDAAVLVRDGRVAEVGDIPTAAVATYAFVHVPLPLAAGAALGRALPDLVRTQFEGQGQALLYGPDLLLVSARTSGDPLDAGDQARAARGRHRPRHLPA